MDFRADLDGAGEVFYKLRPAQIVSAQGEWGPGYVFFGDARSGDVGPVRAYDLCMRPEWSFDSNLLLGPSFMPLEPLAVWAAPPQPGQHIDLDHGVITWLDHRVGLAVRGDGNAREARQVHMVEGEPRSVSIGFHSEYADGVLSSNHRPLAGADLQPLRHAGPQVEPCATERQPPGDTLLSGTHMSQGPGFAYELETAWGDAMAMPLLTNLHRFLEEHGDARWILVAYDGFETEQWTFEVGAPDASDYIRVECTRQLATFVQCGEEVRDAAGRGIAPDRTLLASPLQMVDSFIAIHKQAPTGFLLAWSDDQGWLARITHVERVAETNLRFKHVEWDPIGGSIARATGADPQRLYAFAP